MSITFVLDDEQSRRLEEKARQWGVDPQVLLKAAVNDLISRPDEDFARTARRVLDKNRELYQRLS